MRTLNDGKLILITVIALVATACAEFTEEASEAANTVVDPDATWEQAGDETAEAVKSIAPGEQREGDLQIKVDALDDALRDLESAFQDLGNDPDPILKKELDSLKRTAKEARVELEQIGDDTSDAAKALRKDLDEALKTAELRLNELGDH